MKKNKINKIAKEVVQYEIDALRNLKKSFNSEYVEVIKTLLNCKSGKIIISGVGKSGIIARKWLLFPTGTPSFYLDPSNTVMG